MRHAARMKLAVSRVVDSFTSTHRPRGPEKYGWFWSLKIFRSCPHSGQLQMHGFVDVEAAGGERAEDDGPQSLGVVNVVDTG